MPTLAVNGSTVHTNSAPGNCFQQNFEQIWNLFYMRYVHVYTLCTASHRSTVVLLYCDVKLNTVYTRVQIAFNQNSIFVQNLTQGSLAILHPLLYYDRGCSIGRLPCAKRLEWTVCSRFG